MNSDRPTTSIIISVGPGYDRYVDVAYHSAVSQCMEVIVVWDSCEIPQRYLNCPGQISVNNLNIQRTRRAGLDRATGATILFLDADDALPDGFVASAVQQLLEATASDGRVAGIYPDIKYFDMVTGESNGEFKARAWDRLEMECDNQVAISTLVWAHALRASWWENSDNTVLEDHSMWMSLVNNGWVLVPGRCLELHVRTHSDSVLNVLASKVYHEAYDVHNQQITVAVVLKGDVRSWGQLAAWLEGLPKNSRLVVYDASGSNRVQRMVRDYTWTARDIRFSAAPSRYPGMNDESFACSIYSKIIHETQTPFLFTLSDQCIPNQDAFTTIKELAAGFEKDVAGVCAISLDANQQRCVSSCRFDDVDAGNFECMLARTRVLHRAPLAITGDDAFETRLWQMIRRSGFRLRLSARTHTVPLNRQVLILRYHDLDPSERNQWTLDPDDFSTHLTILREQGYHILPLSDALKSPSPYRKVAVLTFDDGRAGAFMYGNRILDGVGVSACFYISPIFIDGNPPVRESYSRFMDWSQIRTLHECGHLIGSHSMTHPDFSSLSESHQFNEMTRSRVAIAKSIGVSQNLVSHFALPDGAANDSIQKMAADAGYESLVTTESSLNVSPLEPFRLFRWSVKSPCPNEMFSRKLSEMEVLQ